MPKQVIAWQRKTHMRESSHMLAYAAKHDCRNATTAYNLPGVEKSIARILSKLEKIDKRDDRVHKLYGLLKKQVAIRQMLIDRHDRQIALERDREIKQDLVHEKRLGIARQFV